MNLFTEDGENGIVPILWAPELEEKLRISREWRSRGLEELMPDLPRDEQLRLQNRFRERDRIRRRMNKKLPPSSPSSSNSNPDPSSSEQNLLAVTKVDYMSEVHLTENRAIERMRDSVLMPFVLDGLHHYNARHPGAEFDPVKPLMQRRVLFRGHIWVHVNFWACSRTNSKMIKRFFAEIHYKTSHPNGSWDPKKPVGLVPIVEICTIIEEPLGQYKRSCGFCPAEFDILHPKGCRKFVCGNDKDRIGQRLEQCWPQPCEIPFAEFIERGAT
ncbi:hypothetical protein PR202_gb18036 [Eleusine coracana subsp. coracana]|uniref:DUF3615 domain-containing protein n=1 Tax=Eleusine coracana subsp. coracana TaxID=191504 RepID=A0AAV5F564_ELECO|nr:hypothetical protein PR202_gb18036 [Eleusine coracana subsp. coracana]